MSQGRRKYDGVDLMKLMTTWDTKKWNAFLTKCDKNNDVKALEKMRYGMMVGMDNLAKQKLNTDQVVVLYVRMLKSLEKTAKGIFRRKYPNPLDSAKRNAEYMHFLEDKRKRDHELELYFKRSGF